MKVAIIYTSGTGNTEEVASRIHTLIGGDLFHVNQFSMLNLTTYDVVLLGTYTWGNGEIPTEMIPLYKAFENQEVQRIITGVFGTGDSFYPKFCGAVDEFRDMLAVHTNLAVTLKIEQAPQYEDLEKCKKFVDRILTRIEMKKTA